MIDHGIRFKMLYPVCFAVSILIYVMYYEL